MAYCENSGTVLIATQSKMNAALLLWGLLFSSIGVGFLIYGRRQRMIVPLVCGVVLIVFPYFVSNTYVLVVLGFVLIVIPYFFRI